MQRNALLFRSTSVPTLMMTVRFFERSLSTFFIEYSVFEELTQRTFLQNPRPAVDLRMFTPVLDAGTHRPTSIRQNKNRPRDRGGFLSGRIRKKNQTEQKGVRRGNTFLKG